MMRNECYTDDEMLEFLHEEDAEEMRNFTIHVAGCKKCNSLWKELRKSFSKIEYPIPSGGNRALNTALSFLNHNASLSHSDTEKQSSEILTVEDVAKYLKVDVESVLKNIPDIPYFVFNGNIRIRKKALDEYIEDLEKKTTRTASQFSGSIFLAREKV